MADNLPTTKPSFLKKDFAGIPVWGWALIVVGGIVIGVMVLKGKGIFSSLGSSSTATNPSAVDALQGQSGNGTVPTTFNNPGPIGQPNPTGTKYTIRASQAQTGGPYQQFDQTSEGIPIRSTADVGQNTIAYIPYGSQIFITGQPQTGGANYVASNVPGGGSTIWYPVTYNNTSGYISANDIVGIGGGGTDRSYQPSVMGAY